jgi:hypothetical protein
MTPVPDTQTTQGPMTGEEHHRLAELASISEPSPVRSDHPLIRTDHPEVIAVAQVHAILASTAATEAASRQSGSSASSPEPPRPCSPTQRLTSSAEEEYPGTREAEFDLAAAGLWYFAASVVT